MKTVRVNARGLDCPQPVVISKKALSEVEIGEVIVSVDDEVAKDNVKRMAENEGCTVKVEGGEDGFELRILKPASSEDQEQLPVQKKVVEDTLAYMFESDFIGSNRELGKVLVNGFLNAIPSLPERKSAIILISNGVKLATTDSYVLETLSKLAQSGFKILICGTCLDFFKIRDKVQVGTISNALEIMETLTCAGKVIKF
jgi:tRNA 2-thiouridine synthesizing protein A